MKAGTDTYFADTYALIEFIEGNKNYEPYAHAQIVTTIMNLAEVYYIFCRDFGKEQAEHYYNLLRRYVIRIPHSAVQIGMQYKLQHKKAHLSYIDCIGYAIAGQENIPFLTGDKQFEGKPGVAFVK
ncbi:MAG: PIN domain-containing protein [Candidatus Woesearchaeota archaeon]|nr:PIN domain-containing protein [Candidatus Woesearchaeota archaeon]